MSKLSSGTLAPAYGRDYRTATAAQQDFIEGKDFTLLSPHQGGTYCSVRDFAPLATVTIYFNKRRNFTMFKLANNE